MPRLSSCAPSPCHSCQCSRFVNARFSVPRDGRTPSPPARASAAPPIPSCAHPRPRYGVRAASWTRPGNWPGPLRIGLERPIAVDAVPHCRPGACRAPASCQSDVDRRARFSRTRGLFKLRSASPDPHGRRVAVLHPQSAVPAPTAWRAFLPASAAFSSCALRLRSPWSPSCYALRPQSAVPASTAREPSFPCSPRTPLVPRPTLRPQPAGCAALPRRRGLANRTLLPIRPSGRHFQPWFQA